MTPSAILIKKYENSRRGKVASGTLALSLATLRYLLNLACDHEVLDAVPRLKFRAPPLSAKFWLAALRYQATASDGSSGTPRPRSYSTARSYCARGTPSKICSQETVP